MKKFKIMILFFLVLNEISLKSQTDVINIEEKHIYEKLISQVQNHIDSMNLSDKNFYELEVAKQTNNDFKQIDIIGMIEFNSITKEVPSILLKEFQNVNKKVYITSNLIKSKKVECKSSKQKIKKVYVDFSRCAVNNQQALLYFGVQYNSLSGNGYLILMQKEHDEWHVVKKYLKWVS